ncbi:hypothetical protein JAAARDRAFT_52441 [Jaapia argillacea MUCL 33604]|uniref:Ribosomal protein L22 n=1 Tax=Jaapia argillacea MUCL 33604 TaxID=933084 RepID=A0A067QC29_9AGAM|nr:hypothetical protein JAAARDRAFT_52441 [Jaapia argillacea MUCL 33604]
MSWIREKLSTKIRAKNTEEELAAARRKQADEGKLSLFESVPTEVSVEEKKGVTGIPEQTGPKKIYTQHKYSTTNFKISHRKLNDLGRQISGKPIDWAILQMTFSEKRASRRVETMLKTAKAHAVNLKSLNEKKLIVSEAWVTKGPKQLKRIEVRGRAHHGIRVHPDSKLHVVLKEGKTWDERVKAERARKLRRIVCSGLVREDRPLRNPAPMWAW